jgi:hypothetical protein
LLANCKIWRSRFVNNVETSEHPALRSNILCTQVHRPTKEYEYEFSSIPLSPSHKITLWSGSDTCFSLRTWGKSFILSTVFAFLFFLNLNFWDALIIIIYKPDTSNSQSVGNWIAVISHIYVFGGTL